jgi:hypothetical protein
LFFAYSGLRTDVGLLNSPSQVLTCVLIIVLASVGKFGGSLVAARLTGFGWREASAVGILMNTRGLMELIVLNIGLDLGVLSVRLFTMMVIMALVTTFMTSPLLEYVYPMERLKRDLSERESVRSLVPRFTALACVSNEASAPGLVTLAAALAGPTSPDTRVYALRLVPPDERSSALIAAAEEESENDLRADIVLDAAMTHGRALNSEVRPLSFLSSTPATDICDVAEVKRADILLLGWERSGHRGGASVRSVLEEVVDTAGCEVGVVVDRNLRNVRKVLVGFAGTKADGAALRLACRIALSTKAHVTVLAVSLDDDGQMLQRLAAGVANALDMLDASQYTILSAADSQPRRALMSKSAEGFDLAVMSVGAPWGVEPHSFALDPQRVIDNETCSFVLVRETSAVPSDAPQPASTSPRYRTIPPLGASN